MLFFLPKNMHLYLEGLVESATRWKAMCTVFIFPASSLRKELFLARHMKAILFHIKDFLSKQTSKTSH